MKRKSKSIYDELYKRNLKPAGFGDILIASGLVSIAFGTILAIKERMGSGNLRPITLPKMDFPTSTLSTSAQKSEKITAGSSEGALKILGL